MHKEFTEEGGKCTYNMYYKVLKTLNISFTKLGNEECESCVEFFQHCQQSGHTKCNINSECTFCCTWNDHIQRAGISRHHYKLDKSRPPNADERIVSVDLQKVIQLPRMESLKKAIFCNRIIAYNESFVPIGKKSSMAPFAVMWYEGITGRCANDIMSAFRLYITHPLNRTAKFIKPWLDNCEAQNKNWILFLMMVSLVNSDETSTETIELNFFESGHTFMSADSFHHYCEKSMNKSRHVYDFSVLVTKIQEAQIGTIVQVLQVNL
jgi:hypothetical protein